MHMAGKDDDIDLDEIDQLLRAAEKKYGVPDPSATAQSAAKKPVTCFSTEHFGGKGREKPALGAGSFLDEIEKDLASLDELMAPERTQPSASSSKRQTPRKMQPSATDGKKCYPVFLGGSECPVGLTSAGHQRSCNSLRCTRCDFKVLWFDNVEWMDDCDYLFFRNSVPVVERLREKQRRKPGHRSYTCQCQWTTVNTMTNLLNVAQPKWVCSGQHSVS